MDNQMKDIDHVNIFVGLVFEIDFDIVKNKVVKTIAIIYYASEPSKILSLKVFLYMGS